MAIPFSKQIQATFASLRLKTKLQLSFVLIGLLTIVLTGWQAFENARDAIESLTFDRLTSIRETKRRQIESYFQQVRNQVITLADDRTITEGIEELTAAFQSIPSTDRRNNILLSLNHPSMRTGPVDLYQRRHSAFDPTLQRYLQRFGYEDILLADATHGDVVYSVQKKTEFGTNLETGPYSGTNLGSAFRDALNSRDREFARLVDFSPYPPSNFAPAAFVCSPIYHQHGIVGVLIVQLSTTAINRVMTSSNNWRDEGLGETGETYIVGADFRLRTDSRFFI